MVEVEAVEYRNVIDGFENLTAEQCIDMAVRHVLKNGKPSMNSDGHCVYSGIGCAAAPFLKPEVRDAFPASWGWQRLIREGKVPTDNRATIAELQNCHDSAAHDALHTGKEFLPSFKANITRSFPDYQIPEAV